jgi:hypothetical protein
VAIGETGWDSTPTLLNVQRLLELLLFQVVLIGLLLIESIPVIFTSKRVVKWNWAFLGNCACEEPFSSLNRLTASLEHAQNFKRPHMHHGKSPASFKFFANFRTRLAGVNSRIKAILGTFQRILQLNSIRTEKRATTSRPNHLGCIVGALLAHVHGRSVFYGLSPS